MVVWLLIDLFKFVLFVCLVTVQYDQCVLSIKDYGLFAGFAVLVIVVMV